MDAFASIISNNLNIVMKILTSLTILMAIPTLIASLYGMNVGLPFQDDPNSFWLLMFFMVLLAGSMIFLFKRKRWM